MAGTEATVGLPRPYASSACGDHRSPASSRPAAAAAGGPGVRRLKAAEGVSRPSAALHIVSWMQNVAQLFRRICILLPSLD